jgi:hypothetical protein
LIWQQTKRRLIAMYHNTSEPMQKNHRLAYWSGSKRPPLAATSKVFSLLFHSTNACSWNLERLHNVTVKAKTARKVNRIKILDINASFPFPAPRL